MLHIHRVPNYISNFHAASRQRLICLLPIVRSLQCHRQVLIAFAHSAGMLPVRQEPEAKSKPPKDNDETMPVKTAKSHDKKSRQRHKTKVKARQQKNKPASPELGPIEASTPRMDHGGDRNAFHMVAPFSDANQMIPVLDGEKGKKLNQGSNNIAAANGSLGKDDLTPNQKFLDLYAYPSKIASPVGSGASKPAKSSSHRRKFHSETTPNKGGLPKMNCNEYWPLARVEEGIKSGTVLTGSFRINQRNYTTAYITAADGQRDIVIEGIDRRNRAMHGDIVAVELINDDEAVRKEVADISRKLAEEFGNMKLIEEKLRRNDQLRGRVVRIMEKKHGRKAAGVLKPYHHNAYGFAQFSPQDSRIPRIMISLSDCPEQFVSRPQDFQNVLFIAEMANWKATCAMASGKLIKQLGDIGEIEPETEGFLAEYNIDDGPFSEEALACLPQDLPWTIPREEFAKRKDLRSECIFTIDPSTARDLDDALSVKVKEDGNFEVGVHIADVSYFIDEGDALDVVASRRATSVYLVQRVVPMLPRLLCEHLCSLNPGNDKLTYSVIWTIAPDGKILDEWFGRTVIRSCTKLSYEHAQQMIATDDIHDWTQFPDIDGPHSMADVRVCVRHLFELSVLLRQKRFDSGALSLNQPKLTFTLDSETGHPNGFGSYIAADSNRLVEEFMLLANMAVAHRLYKSLPQHAILRRHPSPHPKMIEDLLTLCKRCGVGIDAATSHDLHNSLERLKEFDSSEKEALYFAVISLCSKPMQLAKYFCAGALEDEKLYHHYALNVPLYTHFTSPIRRYPDIMVHRMLSVALGEDDHVLKSIQHLQKLAEECNDKKTSAKKVQELSSELFLTNYIRQLGELRERAVIIGLLDSALDVLLLHSGLVKRVYCNSLPLHKWKVDKQQKDRMTLYWKTEEEEIVMDGNESFTENAVSSGKEVVGKKEAASGKEVSGRLRAGSRKEHAKTVSASKSGDNACMKPNAQSAQNGDSNDDSELAGLTQVLHIFDRTDVILKAEEDRGVHRIKIYIPKPE